MKKPLVSVVIPAYNCAGTIGKAIDSALEQGVEAEIIVVDDHSDDILEAALERYIRDLGVIYLRDPKKLGASGSRNLGVARAKGEYVAFLDADDIWRPGKLVKQLAAMERTGAVLCATARELQDATGRLSGKVIPIKERITYRELLKHNSISCSSVLMKTEVAREFPMHHEDSHEDYIMWLEILQKYGFACGVNEPLLIYSLSNTGKSGSKLKSATMTFKVYRHMGFSLPKSLVCFASYAFNGVWKYYLSRKGDGHEA